MTVLSPAPADQAVDDSWTALHVGLHRPVEDVDEVLRTVVAPIVADTVTDGASWFFLRYWHGGPHLRVRVRGVADPDALAERLRDGVSQAAGTVTSLDPDDFYRAFVLPAGGVPPWHADGEVWREPYAPETDRYGGDAAAMADAEDLFEASSRTALGLLSLHPDRTRLTAAAVDLATAFPRAAGMDDLAAQVWLRRYFLQWQYAAETVQDAAAAVREVAEQDHSRPGSPWQGRAAKVSAALAARPDSVQAQWLAAVADHAERWRARTGGPVPDRALVSQLHMLHNRIGLSITEERYVAWLAALALRPEPVDFHADGATAPDRVLHQESGFVQTRLAGDQRPHRHGRRPRPAAWWEQQEGLACEVRPELVDEGLRSAITQRRSRHGRLSGRVPAEVLGTLLDTAAGVTRRDTLELEDGSDLEIALRAHPSAGAEYALSLRVVVRDVEGIEPGLYHFDPLRSRLHRLAAPPSPRDLAAVSPWFDRADPRVIEVSEAPFVVFCVAELGAARHAYGLRGYRFALLEAGHLVQNLLLTGTDLDLASAPVGGFYDDAAAGVAMVDGVDTAVLYVVPFGAAVGPVTP